MSPDAWPANRYVNVLDGLELQLFLGIHPAERAARQRVLLTVRMTCDYPGPVSVDAINSVVDYDFLRAGIQALAEAERFDLQEVFCERVAALCWRYPAVRMVQVTSTKPDIYPDARIGCEIVRFNPDFRG